MMGTLWPICHKRHRRTRSLLCIKNHGRKGVTVDCRLASQRYDTAEEECDVQDHSRALQQTSCKASATGFGVDGTQAQKV